MRYWKFLQKTKLKQKLFTNSEKEVGNFFKTGTIAIFCYKNLDKFQAEKFLILGYLIAKHSDCSFL